MSTGLVLVHGRSHQLARPLRGDQAHVRDHVAALTRSWMAGLAKGLTLAQRPPIPLEHVHFSFYGNAMADGIDTHESGGGLPPDLELDADQPPGAAVDAPQQTIDTLVVEAARHLGFQPDHGAGSSPAHPHDPAEELDWSDTLRVPVINSALQFLARKTGTAGWIIEDYLTDVAYYLALPSIRDSVLKIVRGAIADALERHDTIVIVSHSLGTIVAYDALADQDTARVTTLLVTAGSPLGLPVVQKHLLRSTAAPQLAVPALAARSDPRWINAFDVRDIVALVHPLSPLFPQGVRAIRDVTTFNSSGPHSIEDYLSDPDVAAPISDASQ